MNYEIIVGLIFSFMLVIFLIAYVLIVLQEKEMMKAQELKERKRFGPTEFKNSTTVVIPDKVKKKSQRVSTQNIDAKIIDVENERYLHPGYYYVDNNIRKKEEKDPFEVDIFAESTLEFDDPDDNNDK